jgi:hypothetical protein
MGDGCVAFDGHGGGCVGDILRMMDIPTQEKEGPKGLGRKNFKIWTQIDLRS